MRTSDAEAKAEAEEVFYRAIEIDDPERRDAFILARCGDDLSLRSFVMRLVAAHEQADQFMAKSPAQGTHRILESIETHAESTQYFQEDNKPSLQEKLGPEKISLQKIGPYSLLEEIGVGGTAIVYRARQESPQRDVALKLLRPGLDSQQITARLHQERQLLALMDHPGIAKVFDAGLTAKGCPFYSMEFVDGELITHFCDSHQSTLRQRVQLILQASEALEHAHQRGIIHRDIKPGNLLVEETDQHRPRLKIIDFGIAKFLHESEDTPTLTRLGQLVGTPQYMSPEQVQEGDHQVDTRTDIFSLGVVLYELLTGRVPVEGTHLLDTIRRIVDEQAKPLSAINPHVDADLENICLMCLKKAPNERYQSAPELSQDLNRYLQGLPVLARPIGRLSRIAKWARRSPGLAALSLATILATLLLVVALLVFNRHLAEQRDEIIAKQRQLEAEKDFAFENFRRAHHAVRNYLRSFKLHTPLGSQKNLAFQRKTMEKGIHLYDELLSGSGGGFESSAAWEILHEVRKERAEMFIEYAKVLMTEGQTETAIEVFEEAIHEFEKVIDSSPTFAADALKLQGIAQTSISKAYQQANRPEEAIQAAQNALVTYRTLQNEGELGADYSRWYMAVTWYRIAAIQRNQNEPSSASLSLQEAELLCEQLPLVHDFRLTHSQVLRLRSKTFADLGQLTQALEWATRSRLIMDDVCIKSMPPELRYESDRAEAMWQESQMLFVNEQKKKGAEHLRSALKLQVDLAGRLPDIEAYTQRLALMLAEAENLLSDDTDRRWIEDLRQRIANGEALPRSAEGIALERARSLMAEAWTEFIDARFEAALRRYEAALKSLHSIPPNAQGEMVLEMKAGIRHKLATCNFELGRYQDALEYLQEPLAPTPTKPSGTNDLILAAFCNAQLGFDAQASSMLELIQNQNLQRTPYLPLAWAARWQLLPASVSRKGLRAQYQQLLNSPNEFSPIHMLNAAIGLSSLLDDERFQLTGENRSWVVEKSLRFLELSEIEPDTPRAHSMHGDPRFAALRNEPEFENFSNHSPRLLQRYGKYPRAQERP